MKRILIAIPTIEYIESATFETVYDLTVPDGIYTTFKTFRGYSIDHVRNVITRYVLDEDFDYLLFVDSDILLPQDALCKLLSSSKLIVSGIYAKKQVTPKLEVNGLGCTLIHRSVLERIPTPHFEYKFSLQSQNVVSEDQFFFAKAAQQGIEHFVDISIKCGHIGKTVFVP